MLHWCIDHRFCQNQFSVAFLKEEDSNCRTALHHAASRGVSCQVATLLCAGASPSHRDSQGGVTPMHFAAVRAFTSCLKLLYRANSLMV